MINKALLQKIKKCLALASSANEHEAAAALAKARALMEEHGIDDEQLELADVGEATARGNRSVRPALWENLLVAVVCHALSVTSFIDARGDRCFIGRDPRPEVATYAFVVLSRQLKAARKEYIATRLKRCKPGRKRARADVFCQAWSTALLIKIRKLIPEPADDAAIGQYLALAYPHLVETNSRTAKAKRSDGDYWAGRSAGHAVDLNIGVGASASPLAIGG